MISGIIKVRKVEKSDVNVANARMTAIKPVESAIPSQPPDRPMMVPAMMPMIRRISNPSCFTLTNSSFQFLNIQHITISEDARFRKAAGESMEKIKKILDKRRASR